MFLDLNDETCAWLQIVPYKGCDNTPPSDPLLYRFYEVCFLIGIN